MWLLLIWVTLLSQAVSLDTSDNCLCASPPIDLMPPDVKKKLLDSKRPPLESLIYDKFNVRLEALQVGFIYWTTLDAKT
jgi:hypothetical protein